MKRYFWTLTFSILVLLSIIVIFKKGDIVTGPEVFLPGYKPGMKLEEIEDPDVKAFIKSSKLFGDRSVLIVILHSSNSFFTKEETKAIRKISKELSVLPQIKTVLSVLDIPKGIGINVKTYGDDPVLSKEVLKDENAKELISRDGKYIALMCYLNPKSEPIKAVENVKSVLRSYQKYSPLIFGEAAIDAALFKELQSQNYVYPPLIFALIFVIFFIQTRSFSASFMSAVIPLLSALITFGVFFLLGRPLNTMTAMVPSYLLIIGSAYGLHFYNGMAEVGNAKKALRKKSIPIIFSMLTTAAGLTSFIFLKITAFKEFGILVSSGLALTTVVIFTVMPEIIKKFKKKPRPLGMKYLGNLTAKIFIITSIIILAVFPLVAHKIKIGTTGVEYFRKSSEISKAYEILKEKFGYRDSVYIIAEKGKPFTAVDNQKIKEIISKVERLKGVSSVVFPVDIPLPIMRILAARQPFLRAFISGNAIRIMVYLDDKGVDNFLSLRAEMEKLLEEYKSYKFTLSGTLVLWSKVDAETLKSQIKSIAFAFIFIFGMILAVFRSVKKTFVGIFPIIVTTVLNFLIMALFSIRLEIGTSIVAGMLMGLVIDYSIHVIHELKSKGSEEAVRSVGPAIVANALGLAAGFSVLFLSTLKLYSNISILMVVGILYGAFSTLAMVPYMLKRT